MPIAESVKLGRDVIIPQPDLVNLYGCQIGDESKIAAFVEIRKDVVIGRRVRIQTFVGIGDGTVIEDFCFVGPHTCFLNDPFPRSVNQDGTSRKPGDWKQGTILVKKGASIGGGCVILPNVTIGENSMIGAGSVVRKDVPANQVWAGNPARFIRHISEEEKTVLGDLWR